MPAGDRACWRLPLQGALAVAGRPLVGGLSRSRLPLATDLAMAVYPSSSLPSLRKRSNNIGREENRRSWLKLQPINHESLLFFIEPPKTLGLLP
ncbi:hypothetical protein B296_00014984 [Ensete ventricosum]|uniref:Uncharacterized protein n=1 Tax=Ensete ventricosum TaxID=4639 RepID=A0A426Z1N1_ENSVE|nr:hypothetical protein B296_00014984 [Ensete ventricosum]